MVGVRVVVFVERMFNSEITPAIRGRIPVGSGELRSLNQRKPSVKMAGFSSNWKESLLTIEM